MVMFAVAFPTRSRSALRIAKSDEGEPMSKIDPENPPNEMRDMLEASFSSAQVFRQTP
jgi:hypothetical protein